MILNFDFFGAVNRLSMKASTSARRKRSSFPSDTQRRAGWRFPFACERTQSGGTASSSATWNTSSSFSRAGAPAPWCVSIVGSVNRGSPYAPSPGSAVVVVLRRCCIIWCLIYTPSSTLWSFTTQSPIAFCQGAAVDAPGEPAPRRPTGLPIEAAHFHLGSGVCQFPAGYGEAEFPGGRKYLVLLDLELSGLLSPALAA